MTHSVFGVKSAQSFTLAGALVILSLISLGLVLRSMFLKKSIALLAFVIVFKWPILIYLLLLLTKNLDLQPVAFSVGALAWLPPTLVWHLIANKE